MSINRNKNYLELSTDVHLNVLRSAKATVVDNDKMIPPSGEHRVDGVDPLYCLQHEFQILGILR